MNGEPTFKTTTHFWGETVTADLVQCGPGNWEVYLSIKPKDRDGCDGSLLADNARALGETLIKLADEADAKQGHAIP